ncbi:MAG TPA: pilus assembly protein TadG-related protein [Gaiellaceae bacterium]|nr:pilus assembly protein TadG-related protein [Gaiellaceae bacterium]
MTARAHNERGQIFGLTVIIMVGLLAFGAFVIDMGRLFYTHRSLQASADAAALAGAQKLPSSSAAVAQAYAYSGSNGQKNARSNVPGVATTASAICRAGSTCSPVNAVQVDQKATISANFAKVLGFGSWDISARAVAQIVPDPMPWAIYANTTDCGRLGIKMNGKNFNIDGAVTSNGRMEVNGENMYADYASYGGPNSCPAYVNATNVSFGASPQPTFEGWEKPWPAWFEPSDFSCTYTASSFNFSETGQEIPTGTYCTSGKFEANGNDQSGTITVISPEIVINGQNQTFRPHQNGVLFFNTSDKELVLNGNSYDWSGIIFSPYARIKINGDESSVLNGMIEGLEVEINGNTFNMIGTGPSGAKRKIKLVE